MLIPLSEAYRITGVLPMAKTASEGPSRDNVLRQYVEAVVKNASTETLDSEARFWGVSDQCQAIRTKIASWKPAAVPATDFLLPEIQKYAAYDTPSLQQAVVAFYDNRFRYPLEMRKTAAITAMYKAEQYGAPIPEYVETYLHKAAGFGYPTVEAVQQMVVERTARSRPEYDVYMDKLATALAAMVDQPGLRYDEDYVKTAMAVIDSVDTAMGLTAHYGHSLSLPEELLADCYTTNNLQKCAGYGQDEVTLINGQSISLGSLTKEALAAVDPDLADLGTAALRDVLPTLPRGDADLLLRLC